MDKFLELKRAVETVEIVDTHAHNIVALHSNLPFISCFSEAKEEDETIDFKRSLNEIAELYGSKLSVNAVQESRQHLGLESSANTCFKAARISALLIDDGLDLDKKLDIKWHEHFAPKVGRILQIEDVAKKILEKCTAFIQYALWSHDDGEADKVTAFKSIVAYRTGLAINTDVTVKEAEGGLSEVLCGGNAVRISNKSFLDYIFMHALVVAQSYDLPMQIDTGFGEKDLDLRLANPLNLRNLLEDKRFTKNRLVLLHVSYPFSKEASYLASVYPQVYLDFGLAIPKLRYHRMISSVKELMDFAPINKVMFSTDGFAFAESFYLGARIAREVVFSVLRDACIDGDLSIPEALAVVKDIFAETAKQFYKLDVSSRYSDVIPQQRFNSSVRKDGLGLTVECMGLTSVCDDLTYDTWLPASGEARTVPDLSTKCRVPWAKHQEMVLTDMLTESGKPWHYCPRDVLCRFSKILEDEYGLVMDVGVEVEFYILKTIVADDKEVMQSLDRTPYCSTAAIDAASSVLNEIVACLQSLNITIEQIHSESGKGQFEIVLGYTDAITQADNLVYTHEIIKGIARKHGLLATFMPKYSPDSSWPYREDQSVHDVGSGSHVHISLSKNGENVFTASSDYNRYGMSKFGESFMAGVLSHVRSICVFSCPLPISPPGTNGAVTNFELRTFDGCANPPLGFAALLVAGIDGLRNNLKIADPA
uniref:GS catalytic domain-containing protein n=1 Tax=Solanum lycopersicum TaxID=4081 RepID=A0A3Q7JG95_SOLLC